MNKSILSKTMSHALRHEPWIYELELDAEGWVPISELIEAMQPISRDWSGINIATFQDIITTSEKQRFEIKGNKIRALYGHSIPGRLSYAPSVPPKQLYHGTTKEIANIIAVEGIRPMGRQFVHLSTDIMTAKEVAKRKSNDVVIFEIDSNHAYKDSVKFYEGNTKVWLSDFVPALYLNII